MSTPPRRPRSAPPRAAVPQALPKPLGDAEIDALQALLDTVPAPLDPLDVGMLDGFLCGLLVQPQAVPAARWLRHVTDVDGRALPAGFETARLHGLVHRRHAELDRAIVARQWFDPWVFELDDADEGSATSTEAVLPWVAGFVTALELFPALLNSAVGSALDEPLALIYRHLDPADLEDAEALLAEIESLEPPADLSEAVEGLVRATLLLADVAGRRVDARKP